MATITSARGLARQHDVHAFVDEFTHTLVAEIPGERKIWAIFWENCHCGEVVENLAHNAYYAKPRERVEAGPYATFPQAAIVAASRLGVFEA